MFEDLFPYNSILFEKGGEGGSGGGGGDDTTSGQEAAVKENNSDIKDLAKSVAGGEDGKDDPGSRHIGYFEEDLGLDDEDLDTAGEGDTGEDDPGEDDPGEDDPGEVIDDIEDDLDPYRSEEDEEIEAGEDPGEGKTKVPEGKEDFFYVPERDAEGRDPYPNAFETRMDAQFAISEKVDTFAKYQEQLEEAGSGIGAAIDPQVKAKIQKYKDLDYPNQVDDDTLRADMVDLDEGLKAVKMKVDRVQSKAEKKQTRKAAEKEYVQAEKAAKKSSQEIGLPDRLNELPEGADKNDLMELVDDQISQQLAEIDQQIEDHQNDEEFLEEKGLPKYNARLNELMAQRREAQSTLKEHRQNIDQWWDAQQEYRAAKEQTTEMTDKEKAQRIDEAFIEFQEDRSQGPNALDIFTKSKDTKPIVHFRQYALSPANREKFDLTTPEGWIKAHSDWKAWVEKNVQAKKNGNQKKKAAEKKSKKRKPIPSPSRKNHSGIVSPTADFDGAQKNNEEIHKLAHRIMR